MKDLSNIYVITLSRTTTVLTVLYIVVCTDNIQGMYVHD